MSFIHFKTVYNINYDKVTFDTASLTLKELKKLITEKTKFSKQVDFDLEITNADTNQVYLADEDVIFKNTRVIVKRVVRSSKTPLRALSPKVPPQTSMSQTQLKPASPTLLTPLQPRIEPPIASLPRTEYDSLAPLNIPSKPIIYIDTTQLESSDSRMDEKAKLESILMTSMTKTSSSDSALSQTVTNTQINTNRFHHHGTKNWPRTPHMMINPLNRPIPPNYVCVICKKPGHLKQLCPEAGTLPRPEERPKFPSGIPRTNLRPAQPGDKFAMLGPEGYVVSQIELNASKIIKKDKPSFLTEEEEEEADLKAIQIQQQQAGIDQIDQIPVDLKCPFGDHIIKDAVLVPCCGHFICCDECIRQKITNDENIECPYEKCDQEIGSLMSITPFHETRKKVNDYLKSLKSVSILPPPTSGDVFLDLILSDVGEKPDLALIGPKSPLQDSKISSSEILSLKFSKEDSEAPILPQLQPALLPTPPLSTALINQVPPPQITYPHHQFIGGFQSRFMRHTNIRSNIQIYPPQAQHFGSFYAPRFPRPMLNIQQQQMYPSLQPSLIPTVQPPGKGLMTETEFYEYQQRLKKETEVKQELSLKIKKNSRSRSRSRRKRTRSRSRSRHRYKSRRRSPSPSRTRRRRSRSHRRRYSRSRSSRKRTRSRSKSRDYSKAEYSKKSEIVDKDKDKEESRKSARKKKGLDYSSSSSTLSSRSRSREIDDKKKLKNKKIVKASKHKSKKKSKSRR